METSANVPVRVLLNSPSGPSSSCISVVSLLCSLYLSVSDLRGGMQKGIEETQADDGSADDAVGWGGHITIELSVKKSNQRAHPSKMHSRLCFVCFPLLMPQPVRAAKTEQDLTPLKRTFVLKALQGPGGSSRFPLSLYRTRLSVCPLLLFLHPFLFLHDAIS